MPGKRSLQNPRDPDNDVPRDGDLENGFKSRRFPKFRDAVDMAVAERTTLALKKQLKVGVDIEEFERYRKSDDEVRYNTHVSSNLSTGVDALWP